MVLPFRLHVKLEGKWAEKVNYDLENPDPKEREYRQKTLAKARKIREKYFNGD